MARESGSEWPLGAAPPRDFEGFKALLLERRESLPARLVLAPDWKPITWTEEERKKGQAWGLKTIESFHTHGTPPLPGQAGHEDAANADLSEKGIAS